MKLEMTILEKRLKAALRALATKYGTDEVKLADYIFRHAMGQLHENASSNQLSHARTTAAFIDLVNIMDSTVNELLVPKEDNSQN